MVKSMEIQYADSRCKVPHVSVELNRLDEDSVEVVKSSRV